MTSNIPGPKPWPILGNTLSFSYVQNLEELLALFLSLPKKYFNSDKILKIWMGPKLIIALGNPKHIATVLSCKQALDKDPVYDYIGIVGNRGVFFQNGAKWQELRKPLIKSLNKNRIESYLDIFHEKSFLLCKQWSKFAGNGEYVNLRHQITNYSIDTIAGESPKLNKFIINHILEFMTLKLEN
ncbi:hypothetical protein O3M35_012959 [Rhynocoris fuscipes]|uniref:Cytochrome P450 n=1 Tax=Rhynocoris fuscipes TaxID=488301 RepID=A0AAW1CG12_9HEMI